MVPTECKESKQCAPAKHHYDECVERVTSQQENDGGAKEDCVEECKSNPAEIPSPLGGAALLRRTTTPSPMLTYKRSVFHLAHCATGCAAPKLWSKLR